MMSESVLTVIVLTYNHKEYIENCVNSILRQKTNYKYEIIISDDASTDGTTEIVEKLSAMDSRIKTKIQRVNVGCKECLKNCLKDVQSDFFAIVDGDDYWTDDHKIQMQIDALKENEDCVICATDTCHFFIKDKTVHYPLKKYKKAYYKWNIANAPYCHTSSRIYRNIIPKNDKDLNFILLDIFLYYYALDKGNLFYINKVTSQYNITEKGIYSRMTEDEKDLDHKQAFLFIDHYFKYKYTKIFQNKYISKASRKLCSLRLPILKNKFLNIEFKIEKV